MAELPSVDINYVINQPLDEKDAAQVARRATYYSKLQELNNTSADCVTIVAELLKYVHNTALDSFVKLDDSIKRMWGIKFRSIYTQNIATPTITDMNVLSLQYIILFTETERGNKKQTIKDLMKNYPESETITGQYTNILNAVNSEYKQLNWFNFNHCKEILKILAKGPYGSKTEYTRLVDITCGKTDTCIITLLGEMSFEEILLSMASRIHYIGFSFIMVWADGRHYTPFEFMHHDLIHIENFENIFYDKYSVDINEFVKFYDVLSPNFIQYVTNNYPRNQRINVKDICDNEFDLTLQLSDYMYVLFILAHETYSADFFHIPSNAYTPTFRDSINMYLKLGNLNKRLQDEHNLGIHKLNNEKLILSLSYDSKRVYLETIYNNLLELVKMFRAAPASSSNAAGGSSNTAAGGARKTRRRQKKRRATAKRRGRAKYQGRNGGAQD
jgi:hypothetical protein